LFASTPEGFLVSAPSPEFTEEILVVGSGLEVPAAELRLWPPLRRGPANTNRSRARRGSAGRSATICPPRRKRRRQGRSSRRNRCVTRFYLSSRAGRRSPGTLLAAHARGLAARRIPSSGHRAPPSPGRSTPASAPSDQSTPMHKHQALAGALAEPIQRRPSVEQKGPVSRAFLIGTGGLEPPTSCSQSRRATRLRYVPS